MAYDPTATWPTMLDITKTMDPDGSIATIGKVFSYATEAYKDMPFREANGKTHHRVTVETGLPSGTWRTLNTGIKATNSGTVQVDEGIGILENRAEIDLLTARLSSDIAKTRAQKGDSIVRGLAKQVEDTIWYGDTTTYPNRFHGMHPRYDSIGAKTDTFSANTMNMVPVYSNGGSSSGAMSSVFLVGWGLDTVYGIYPQGSPAGIESEDLGIIDLHDVDGNVSVVTPSIFVFSLVWPLKIGGM